MWDFSLAGMDAGLIANTIHRAAYFDFKIV